MDLIKTRIQFLLKAEAKAKNEERLIDYKILMNMRLELEWAMGQFEIEEIKNS